MWNVNTSCKLTIEEKYCFCFIVSLLQGLQHKNMKLVITIPMKQPIQAVSTAIKLSFPASDTFVCLVLGGILLSGVLWWIVLL